MFKVFAYFLFPLPPYCFKYLDLASTTRQPDLTTTAPQQGGQCNIVTLLSRRPVQHSEHSINHHNSNLIVIMTLLFSAA